MNWLIGITGFLIAAWVLGKIGKFFGEMLDEFLRGLE